MKKITSLLMLFLMCLGSSVWAQESVIKDGALIRLKNSQHNTYMCSGVSVRTDRTPGAVVCTKNENPLDEKFSWALIAEPGGKSFKMYNLKTQLYMKGACNKGHNSVLNENWQFGLVPEPDAGSFEFVLNDDNTYAIRATDYKAGTNDKNAPRGYLHGTDWNGVVRWTATAQASHWTVEVVQSVNVTFDYYIDGDSVASRTVAQEVGKPYCPPILAENVVNECMDKGNVAAEQSKNVRVNVTEILPFEKSVDFDQAKWFYMTIKENLYLSNEVATDGSMPLTRTTTTEYPVENKDLWCFVGNSINGFKIYNKADGKNKILSAPKEIAGDGGTSYVKMANIGDNTRNETWQFVKRPDTDDFFMYQTGIASNKINVRSGKLAFWTSGADNGSTLSFSKPLTNENLVKEIEALLENKGKVGYPKDAKFQELQAQLDAVKSQPADYQELYNSYASFYSSNDINMPVAGKAYVFTNVHPSQGKHYIDYSESGLTYVARGEGDANSLPMSAKFICQKVGEKYIFVNNAGKYLVFKGSSSSIGENANKGYVDSYNETHCSMTFNKMALNGNNTVAASSLKDLLGYVAFGGQRKDKMNESSYFIYSKNGEHFNQDGSFYPRFQDAHSTAFLVEEVSYANNPQMTAITGDLVKIKDATSIATFSAPFATEIPAGVSAYYITSVNANNAALAKVEGTVLPKNTGVILAGTTAGNVTMVPSTDAGTEITNNLLMNTAGAVKENVAANSIFILANGNNGIGFYYGQAGNLAMNKAYVEKSSVVAAGVNALKLVYDGETTGVESVEVEENVNAPIFDLSGRRVMNTIKGGIYIQNGKKFIVK